MQQFINQLSALLKADLAELNQLEFVLNKEKISLEHRDHQAIDKLTSQKQQLVQSLESRAKQKATLLACSPLKIRPGQVRDKICSLGDDQLIELWDQSVTKLGACKQSNLINGTIISHSLQRTNRVMSILRGQANIPTTYGQSGKARSYGGSTSIAKA